MNEDQLIELIKEKDIEAALELLFQQIEKEPEEANHYINAGTLLAEAGKEEEAERFFQKALTLNKEHGGAYYGLANIYFNHQRFTEAIKLYQKAIEYGLKDADTYYMLAMCFVNLGDHKAALAYMLEAYNLKSADDEIAFQYGLVLCQLEMYQQGILVFDKLLMKNNNHADALYNKALAQFMIDENIEQAINTFKAALIADPEHMLSAHAIKNFETMQEG